VDSGHSVIQRKTRETLAGLSTTHREELRRLRPLLAALLNRLG
jgi:hypothetical protein